MQDTQTVLLLLALAGGLAVWALIICARLERRMAEAHDELDQVRAGIQTDLRTLCSTQRTASDRLVAVEGELRRLRERLARPESKAPDSVLYQHAIALASRGATPDELQGLGLAPGEAELVHRLHEVKG